MEKTLILKKERLGKELKPEIISEISRKELKQIRDLVSKNIPIGDKNKDINRSITNRNNLKIVLRDKKDIVGFALAIPERYFSYDSESFINNRNLYIQALAVKEEARGGGLNQVKKMMELVISEAIRNEFEYISADVRVSNGLARILQRRYGFSSPRGADAYAYEKDDKKRMEYIYMIANLKSLMEKSNILGK
jgi:ribosomal protein S18 acetylase RimI-like enzyme